jgi:hypothetical protein
MSFYLCLLSLEQSAISTHSRGLLNVNLGQFHSINHWLNIGESGNIIRRNYSFDEEIGPVAGPCPACDVSYASLGLGIASADGLSAFVAAMASFRCQRRS